MSRAMQDALASQKGIAQSGDVAYKLPDARCATCGQSTRRSLHHDCHRSPQGYLLIEHDESRRAHEGKRVCVSRA
jgi:hypothetical protein